MAGRLSTFLEVWTPVRTSDGAGGSQYRKSNARNVWCKLEIQKESTTLLVNGAETIRVGDMVTVPHTLLEA